MNLSPTSYREALESIMKIANESSEQSRRMQLIHELTMTALGLTYNQRAERHAKALQRSEQFKEDTKNLGTSEAKKNLKLSSLVDNGEEREQIRVKASEMYV